MDKKRKKLRHLLQIFKFAADQEKKQQKLYLRARRRFQKFKDCALLFEWLYNEEVKHEDKLREKYISLKKEMGME